MTLPELRERIEAIRRTAERDTAEASAMEGRLHREVAALVDQGEADIEHVKLALTTLNIQFSRGAA